MISRLIRYLKITLVVVVILIISIPSFIMEICKALAYWPFYLGKYIEEYYESGPHSAREYLSKAVLSFALYTGVIAYLYFYIDI